MSTCFDIYTLAVEGCAVIQTYPSQVHPGGGGGRPSGPITNRGRGRIELSRKVQDDDLAIALALLLLD